MAQLNTKALADYVSAHLYTAVARISPEGELTELHSAGKERPIPAVDLRLLYRSVLDAAPRALPHLVRIGERFVCGIAPAEEEYLLTGPLLLERPVPLRYTAGEFQFPEDFEKRVRVCSLGEVADSLILIYELSHSDRISQYRFIEENCVEKDLALRLLSNTVAALHSRSLSQRKHNPYDQEVRELAAIESGDMEGFLQSIEEVYEGSTGILSRDPLRNMKDIAIVVIANASRAAIRGGVPPETAFSMADSSVQMLEDARDEETVMHLFRTAEIHYLQLVHSIRREKAGMSGGRPSRKDPHIDACKQYIAVHIQDCSVQSAARALNLNVNYLSNLFVKREGIPLSRYIADVRIRRAKSLLKYSALSCAKIAMDLGYSSQSHFGKRFLEAVGQAPGAYRRTFRSLNAPPSYAPPGRAGRNA